MVWLPSQAPQQKENAPATQLRPPALLTPIETADVSKTLLICWASSRFYHRSEPLPVKGKWAVKTTGTRGPGRLAQLRVLSSGFELLSPIQKLLLRARWPKVLDGDSGVSASILTHV